LIEFEKRRSVFEKRVENIRRHNSKGQRRWTAGINGLTDRTDLELAQMRGLPATKMTPQVSQSEVVSIIDRSQELPTADNESQPLDQVEERRAMSAFEGFKPKEEKSWAHLRAVRADVDQQICGSCWAEATATVLQANAEIKGHHRTFSPQELVDCVPNPHHCGGTGGCKGSTVELAMVYVMDHGLDTLAQSPYTGVDQACKKKHDRSLFAHDGDDSGLRRLEKQIAVGFHAAKSHTDAGYELGLRGWERLPENDYEPLLHAVAHTGPVAVSVAAQTWHPYISGIFDDCDRDTVIDHAAALVGYSKDEDSGDKYWIIKNSWGNTWGEDGNLRLLRHTGNTHCGTDHQPEMGTGCNGGPSKVRICGMCGILYDAVVPHFREYDKDEGAYS
jgi:cathepsin L